MGVINSIINRIRGSGLKNEYYKHYTTEYFKNRQEYWNGNSIYIDNIFNKISTDVALAKFKHIKITKQTGPDVIEQQLDEINEVLTISANENKTPFIFWSETVRKILTDGVAAVIPVYQENKIKELLLADEILEADKQSIIISIDEIDQKFDKKDIFIFENPRSNITNKLTSVANIIDNTLKELNGRTQGQIEGFLKLHTMATDGELKERAQKRVANIYDTAKSGGIGYLQMGEEFQQLNRPIANEYEVENLKKQLFQAFGLSEELFNCNYTEEQYRAYYQSVVKVYIRVIQEELNRKIFTKTARTQGHKILMYIDLYDITSLKELNEFAFKQKYAGNLNSNEVREIFGYGGYVGGEVYETNKNAVRIEQQEDA